MPNCCLGGTRGPALGSAAGTGEGLERASSDLAANQPPGPGQPREPHLISLTLARLEFACSARIDRA
jgi:hypothetical protein